MQSYNRCCRGYGPWFSSTAWEKKPDECSVKDIMNKSENATLLFLGSKMAEKLIFISISFYVQ